jgi:lactam utilization protein B
MAARVDEDTKLLELLNRHPELKQRVRALADIAEDADGDLVHADEAERRVIEEVRRVGQETLHSWAEGRIARGEEEQLQADGVCRAGKKNSAGTLRSEPSR